MMNTRNKIDDAYSNQVNIKKRFKKTLEWLDTFEISGNSIDIGDRTLLTKQIEKHFDLSIDNTSSDLDYSISPTHRKPYDNIFCFEIVEHLMNPLFFMEQMKSILAERGSIFLSIPIDRPGFLRNKEHHFHEFYWNELKALIDKSGFVFDSKETINTVPFWWIFTGIRPIIRFVKFNRTILLRLKNGQ